MIYNNAPNGGQQISLTGQGTVTFTPPTSGTYQGIMLFQARVDTQTVKVAGGNGFSMAGVIYAAGAQVSITGSGSAGSPVAIASAIVSKSITSSGSGTVEINPNNGYNHQINWFATASSTPGQSWMELP
jgi:hypothetical protein